MGDEFGVPREEADVNITTAAYSLENSILGRIIELTYDVEHYWTTGLDFRLKLLVLLVIWLTINSILIKVAWSCYGDTFSQMFYVETGTLYVLPLL